MGWLERVVVDLCGVDETKVTSLRGCGHSKLLFDMNNITPQR